MARLVTTLAVSFLLVTSPVFPWSGECVWVIDGDSIVVMHDGKPEEIRLHGVDCPEWAQAFGLEAARFTAEMVLRKTVEVEPRDSEKSRCRTVAAVSVDGKLLTEELVRAGLAWWYQQYAPNDTVLEALQADARRQRLGLFSEDNPVPPWDVRKRIGKGKCP
jgi:micrococcal nuclease